MTAKCFFLLFLVNWSVGSVQNNKFRNCWIVLSSQHDACSSEKNCDIDVWSNECVDVCQVLPFFVPVPLKLWCGHSGGVTLQCPHAAHLSLWALSFLYCWRVYKVTQWWNNILNPMTKVSYSAKSSVLGFLNKINPNGTCVFFQFLLKCLAFLVKYVWMGAVIYAWATRQALSYDDKCSIFANKQTIKQTNKYNKMKLFDKASVDTCL